jgi:heptosyltransferase-2
LKGRILVIRGGAIGDFILTLPVFPALRKAFPDTAIDVMGYPHIASLARLAGSVDGIHAIESRALAGYFARGGVLDPTLAEYFESCHVIFSYLFDPDLIFTTNLARVTKAQIIQGPHRPDEASTLHATHQLLKPLERLAIFDAADIPRFETLEPKAGSETILAIHPGSGSAQKNWPEACWVELLRTVATSTTWQIRLVGGEVEEMTLQRMAEHLPLDRFEIWHKIPLPILAEKLSHCTRFIGHDSGISHLAAAVGLPTMVLWGPTNEKIWRPRGPKVAVLRHPVNLAALSPRAVAKLLFATPPTA